MRRICLPVLFSMLMSGSVAISAAADAQAVPKCELQSLAGGQSFDLASYAGKVVYLDFWASWCGPCLQSMPFMQSLQQSYQSKGLQVVTLNVDENPEDAKAFISEHGVTLPVVVDRSGECASAFQVSAMPSSFLIDRKGKIRHVEAGFHLEDREAITRRVTALLAE